MRQTPSTRFLSSQLEHVEWEGFHFYDLIFPLFVFLAGVSLVFSLTKAIERAGPAAALTRVFRRGILLFLLGIVYSGGLTNPWPDIRLLGVLNTIAIAYLFAGLFFCLFKPRSLVAICVGLLLGYWALLALVPIRDIQLTKASLAERAEKAGDSKTAELFRQPGNPSAVKDSPAWAAAQRMFLAETNFVRGKFDQGRNVANHFDFQHLPARKYDVFFDPEGILSWIGAITACLLGVFAGLLLKDKRVGDGRKVLLLVAVGIAAVGVGWLWDLKLPAIKKIWSPSYVLVAAGYSAMLLGLFYFAVDVWKARKWCQPLVWMGMNSITIYMASNIIGGFRRLAARLVGGDVRNYFDANLTAGAGDMAVSIVGLLLAFWLVGYLYKRKVFLRL
jgi:predicted acyltransferase